MLWFLLVGDSIVQKLMTSCIFSASSLFINNSVTPDNAGSVNGIAMTVTAATRLVYKPLHDKSKDLGYASSKNSDQLGHPLSLISLHFPPEDS